jgi:hypothetical protein
MAKQWAEMTISEKLDCLREQLGEILDELHARPDASQSCGHYSLDNGSSVDARDVALSRKKSVQLSIVRH